MAQEADLSNLPEVLREEIEGLTQADRAAVLLLLLGEDEAANILKYMNPSEVQRLGAAMVSAADLSQELATSLGRAPTQTELADFMGKDVSDYQKERSHAHQMLMVDSEAAEDEMLNAPAQQGYEPEEEVSDSMMMAQLTDSIAKLPERDQVIMALYYNEEMNLKEIGAVLDISESRVSQLLSANVQKLRKMMALATD
ncbi:sigma-70 family RNA polymerase sigma factor [Litoricolaceae bacterium]|nr:sigma-70 family RNA polymerase sigma factor [Litorivicinaceae bacterium]